MAIALTLPGVKAGRRRPVPSYTPPIAPPQVPMPARQMAAPVQAQSQGPVSTGLDPAIVARLASKAGISDATLNKLATMIPALLNALSLANAPRDLVRDASGKITGSVVRPQAPDMTGQTDVG